MTTSDRSHRDDFNLTDVDRADAYGVAPPVLEPVIVNAAAEKAAKAQRAAATPVPVVPGQRAFTDDLPPPLAPVREYTVGGGAEAPAASSSAPSSDDEDDPTAVIGAVESGGASRGPPAPFAIEADGETSWAARAQLEAHALADDPEGAADWLASPYAEATTLDVGEDSWSSWRP